MADEKESAHDAPGAGLCHRMLARPDRLASGAAFDGYLERVKGIEPSYAAWEAAVLPLNYTRTVRRFYPESQFACLETAALWLLQCCRAWRNSVQVLP